MASTRTLLSFVVEQVIQSCCQRGFLQLASKKLPLWHTQDGCRSSHLCEKACGKRKAASGNISCPQQSTSLQIIKRNAIETQHVSLGHLQIGPGGWSVYLALPIKQNRK